MENDNYEIMTVKDELNKSLRTVKTRDYVFTVEQMQSYRIKGVFNSIGEMESMTSEYIEKFALGVYRPQYGEVGVVETAIKEFSGGKKNPLKIVSVIVFADIWSWNMFAIKHQDIYMGNTMGGFGGLEPLLN